MSGEHLRCPFCDTSVADVTGVDLYWADADHVTAVLDCPGCGQRLGFTYSRGADAAEAARRN